MRCKMYLNCIKLESHLLTLMKDVSYAIIIYKLINSNKIQGELSRKKNLVTRDFNMLYFTLVNSYVAGDAWKDYRCSRDTYFDKLKE